MHLMLKIELIINNYDTWMANKLQDTSQFGLKCLLKSHPEFGTAVTRQLRPEFKFSAKIEMAFSQILVIK